MAFFSNKLDIYLLNSHIKLLLYALTHPIDLFLSQVLFALCDSVNLEPLAENLLSSLSKDSPVGSSGTVASSEYRTRVSVYLIASLISENQ